MRKSYDTNHLHNRLADASSFNHGREPGRTGEQARGDRHRKHEIQMSRWTTLPERAVRKAVVLSERGADLSDAIEYYQAKHRP